MDSEPDSSLADDLSPALAALLAPTALRRLTDAGSFQRGEVYAAAGRVTSLAIVGDEVRATVEGSEAYRVRLRADASGLDHSCTCPIGEQEDFCKHCVAAAMVSARAAAGIEASEAGDSDDPVAAIRRHLEGLGHGELVDLVLEHAIEDEAVFERLRLRAHLARPAADPVAAFRRAFDAAAGDREFVPWRESFDFASGFREVVDHLRELLDSAGAAATAADGGPDGPAAVIEIAEYGIAAVEDAIGRTDDSSGLLGDALNELAELHLAACSAAAPEAVPLARRLFHGEVYGDWDTYAGAAASYREVLGEAGLAEYRRLAEALWRELPALGPGEDDDSPKQSHLRWRLASILEDLLGSDPDPRDRVAIIERDLSTPRSFLRMAELWREAGSADRALEWAERGVASFEALGARPLIEFLAGEYHRRGRHEEAVELAWDEYERSPSLRSYQALKHHADQAGDWPERRERALMLLRERMPNGGSGMRRPRGAPAAPRGSTWRFPDGSELVRVFLWEGDDEAALGAAREHDCSVDLWRAIAERREADHPEDAIPAYQRAVQDELARKSKEGYAEAVELLGKIRRLMERIGHPAAFDDYLESVVAQHRRKRNFMKLLAAAGMIAGR